MSGKYVFSTFKQRDLLRKDPDEARITKDIVSS
jgi:hypothetical protein